MDATATPPIDLLRTLTEDAILSRMAEIRGAREALSVLLRAIRARDRRAAWHEDQGQARKEAAHA